MVQVSNYNNMVESSEVMRTEEDKGLKSNSLNIRMLKRILITLFNATLQY